MRCALSTPIAAAVFHRPQIGLPRFAGPDARTLAAYARHAEDNDRNWRSTPAKHAVGAFFNAFTAGFPPNARILDIGAGTGKHMAALQADFPGFRVEGIEPVAENRALALRAFPQLAGRLHPGSLPAGIPAGPWDGMLASALVMHLDEQTLPAALQAMHAALKPGGRVLMTAPTHYSNIDDRQRDPKGRLFIVRTPETLVQAFQRAGFRALHPPVATADDLARADVQWYVFLLEKPASP